MWEMPQELPQVEGKDEERTALVMELNKETEIYLQTTMLVVVMKLNGRLGRGRADIY